MNLRSFLSLVFIFSVFFGAHAQTMTNASTNSAAGSGETLYKRLGGYDVIAAVTDDFLARITSDKQLSRFFLGHSTDSLKKNRQHIVDFLAQATGGPANYTGRSMKLSHDGLGITEQDWQIAVTHLVATLEKFKVPERDKNELLTMISSLKKDIATGPAPSH